MRSRPSTTGLDYRPIAMPGPQQCLHCTPPRMLNRPIYIRFIIGRPSTWLHLILGTIHLWRLLHTCLQEWVQRLVMERHPIIIYNTMV